MRFEINSLVICLMLASSLTFKPVSSITPRFMGGLPNPKETMAKIPKLPASVVQKLLTQDKKTPHVCTFREKDPLNLRVFKERKKACYFEVP